MLTEVKVTKFCIVWEEIADVYKQTKFDIYIIYVEENEQKYVHWSVRSRSPNLNESSLMVPKRLRLKQVLCMFTEAWGQGHQIWMNHIINIMVTKRWSLKHIQCVFTEACSQGLQNLHWLEIVNKQTKFHINIINGVKENELNTSKSMFTEAWSHGHQILYWFELNIVSKQAMFHKYH